MRKLKWVEKYFKLMGWEKEDFLPERFKKKIKKLCPECEIEKAMSGGENG